MRVAVLEVGARGEQRAGLAQVRADRPVGRVELVVDDAALAAEPQPVGPVEAARSTAKTGSMPFALHSSKSSSPWSGAMWTRPVPWSVVTKSPGRNGRGLAKKPAELVHRVAGDGAGELGAVKPAFAIGCSAIVPAVCRSLAPSQSAVEQRNFARPESSRDQ